MFANKYIDAIKIVYHKFLAPRRSLSKIEQFSGGILVRQRVDVLSLPLACSFVNSICNHSPDMELSGPSFSKTSPCFNLLQNKSV